MAFVLKSRHGGYIAAGPRRPGEGCLVVDSKAHAAEKLPFPDADSARAWIAGVREAQKAGGARRYQQASAFPAEV